MGKFWNTIKQGLGNALGSLASLVGLEDLAKQLTGSDHNLTRQEADAFVLKAIAKARQMGDDKLEKLNNILTSTSYPMSYTIKNAMSKNIKDLKNNINIQKAQVAANEVDLTRAENKVNSNSNLSLGDAWTNKYKQNLNEATDLVKKVENNLKGDI